MDTQEHLHVRIGNCTASVVWEGEPTREDYATLVAILQAMWHLDTVGATQEQLVRLQLLRKRSQELGDELDKLQRQALDAAERLRLLEQPETPVAAVAACEEGGEG